jgi:4-hydroxybenzoate polyprenyltransferase
LLTDAPAQNSRTAPSQIKLFLALSRTPHALLDMAMPVFGALLWLGHFPPIAISLIGLLTVFAGYTAVYALNDVIDYRVDQEKAKISGGLRESDNYLDAAMIRHPMAQGLLSFPKGLAWALAWSIVAIVGAWLLNPVCVLIFIGGCLLEAVYCWMLRISPMRTLISGAVKTSGTVAAVFAVDADPSLAFVALLFFWLFFWEIGGQNIPADWADIDADRKLNAQTIPVRFGPRNAAGFALAAIIVALIFKIALIGISPLSGNMPFYAGALLLGAYLLLPPVTQLYRSKQRRSAMVLFNRASYYPPAMLALILLVLAIR